MRIVYTEKWGFELSGTIENLKTIKNAILLFLQSDNLIASIKSETNFDPSPYYLSIPFIKFIKEGNLINVQLVKDALTISGSVQNLNIFSDYFDFEPETPSNYHIHFEHYEGHLFIKAGAVPLIITVTTDNT